MIISAASSSKFPVMLDNISDLVVGPVFDAVDIGLIVLDGEGCVVRWNDWIARVSHRPAEDAIGKSFFNLFPSMHGTRLASVITDTLEIGSSSILTHALNKLLPLTNERGEPLLHNIVVGPISSLSSRYCLLQISDVTVSVTRERVLRERQNARYHAIVDSAPDAIVTVDRNQVIQWVNGATEKVFGYSHSDLLGNRLDVLLGAENDLLSLLGQGTGTAMHAVEVVGRTKSGRSANFEVSFGHWRADQRDFVTTIWRDVTERIAADIALRESESRQRILLEALPQLVWACDPDGLCNYTNPQWQSFVGGPVPAHEGRGWLDVIHQDDRQAFETAWQSALASGAVFDAEARLRAANGAYRWFKMRSIPVAVDGERISRWFGTATDITDMVEARNTLRKSNEELERRVEERTREREIALRQLHESQKMESIGQLTGGVAHDFNNLLAVVIGSLGLLKKNIPDDPRVSRLLDRAIQGAERGATLTGRLLAFARRQELKVEVVDLKSLIPEMLDFLRHSVGPNIAVQVEIAPDVNPIEVDANQLEMCLINLAVNARDAMPSGGSLTLACRNGSDLDKGSLSGKGYVRISIRDTGEGMSEATRARAREPFFTTKGIGKGTGLGLSMVHGFTAQSGGSLDIVSELGKGTDVTLCLPQAKQLSMPTASTHASEAPRSPTARSLRVLLVDDDILVSMGAADMLMELGHSVTEAPSANHAMQILRSDPAFDVVITDYAMPGMNGFELALEIKRLNPSMPIILATGYSELPGDQSNEFERLPKPYRDSDLAKALATAVNAYGATPH